MASKNSQDQSPAGDELESAATRVAELEQLVASRERELALKDSRIAELEQAVADRDSQIAALKQSVAELESGLSQAVASYRALVVKSNPAVPAEMISGDSVISRLLSFVPDILFIEGNKAYVVNPQASDSSVYSYGSSHYILDGRYKSEAFEINRVQVEGYDPVQGKAVVVDCFTWSQIDRLYDRLRQLEDKNIDSVTKAEERGEAYLRGAEVDSVNGSILIPVNCGQQLYDVIDITDSRASLDAARRRVLGITLVYSPKGGEYQQRLLLGGV